jgi:hypothetical protein
MNLPPSIPYLSHLALRNLPTTALWYGVFRLFAFYFTVTPSTWLAVLVVLSTQVTSLIAVALWERYRDRRDAAANGAVMVPQVQERAITMVSALVKNVCSGYPSGCSYSRFYRMGVTCFTVDPVEEWREQYGNIFNLDLAFDHLVRLTKLLLLVSGLIACESSCLLANQNISR